MRTLAIGLLLLGCSSSHHGGPDASDDAGPDALDAGPGALDGGDRVDAGRRGLTACSPEAPPMGFGDGCFCGGPAALFGETLYRQALGIEIWDVSNPAAPVSAGHVEERASSQGGLAVYQGHLLSITNFEPALRIYALDDPRAPTLRAELRLPEPLPAGLAISDEGFALVTTEGTGNPLMAIDLSDLDRPTQRYVVSVEGSVNAVVADGDRIFLSTRETSPARSWLEVRELATGALLDRQLMEEGDASSFFAGLAVHRGRLVRTIESGVQLLDLSGASPVEVGRLDTLPDRPISVAVSGDLAVIGGSALIVADLSDPSSPRELGRATIGLGDSRALLLNGEVAFFSNGNGFVPVTLNCD